MGSFVGCYAHCRCNLYHLFCWYFSWQKVWYSPGRKGKYPRRRDLDRHRLLDAYRSLFGIIGRMRGENDEFYLVLTMKNPKKMKKYLKKVLTNHFSCAILFKRSRKTALEMPKCRCGGIGRRPGLKIPWENIPYRFDPGHRHQFHIAEWSNPVARRAHNPEVAGSNPVSATRTKVLTKRWVLFLFV